MIVQPEPIGPRSGPARALRLGAFVLPVALLVGAAGIGLAGPKPEPRQPASPAAEGSATPPPPSPALQPAVPAPSAAPLTATGGTFPAEVAGLQVHGVRWTVEARNRGLARGVIAIAGYLGTDAIPDDCRADPRLGIFSAFCRRVAVIGAEPWTGPVFAPDHPGFHLHAQFPVGVRMPSQASFMAVSPGTRTPPVILLARFDDARAVPCVPEGRHCGQELVVERVAWVDGTDYPSTPTVDPAITDVAITPARLRRNEAALRPLVGPLSFVLLRDLVRPATIAAIEPAAAAAAGTLAPDTPVWFVRSMRMRGDPFTIEWWVVDAGARTVLAAGTVSARRAFAAAAPDGPGAQAG